MFTVRTARNPGNAVPQVSMGFEADLETGALIVSQQNLGTENLQSTVSKEGLHTSTTMQQTATDLPQQGFVPLLADIATSHQNIHFQTSHNDPVSQGAANMSFIERGTVDAEPVISICPNEAGSLASYNNLSFIKNADGNYVIIHHPPQLGLISETSGELQDAVANISEHVDATGDSTAQSIIISNQDILQTFQTTDAEGNVVINELQGTGFNLDGTSYTMTEKDLQKPLASGATSSKLEKFSREQLVNLGSSNEEIIGNLFLNSRLRVGRPKKMVSRNVDKPDSQIELSDPAGIDTSVTLGALKTEHVVQKQPRCMKSESLNDVKHAQCSPAEKVSNISVENQSSTTFPKTSDIESNNSKRNENNISFEINMDKDENVDCNQQGETESEKSGCSNARPQRKRKYTAKVKEMLQTTDICKGKHKRQKQSKKVRKVKPKQDKEVKINNDMFFGTSEENLKEICPLRRSCRPVKPSAESITRVSLHSQEMDTNGIHGNGATFCKTRTRCKQKTILPQETTDLEEVSEGRGLDISSIKQYYDGDSLVIKLPPICMNILKGKQLTVELDVDNDLSVSQIRMKSVSEGHSRYSFTVARSVNTTPECDTKSSCHYMETNEEKELHSETGHKIHNNQENVNCDISSATQCPNDVDCHNLLPCSTGVNSKEFKNSLHELSTVTGSLADSVAVIEKVDANDDNEANLTVESFMSSFNKELQQIPGMCPDSEGADYDAADTVCPLTPSTNTNFKAEAEVEGQLTKHDRRDMDTDDDASQALENKSRGKTERRRSKKPADKRKVDKDVKTSEAKKYTVRIADNGTREYVCPQCGYFSKYSHNTLSHIVAHSAEKKWVCDECGRPWKSRNRLQKHLVVHQRDRPFSCPLCPQKFKSKPIMKQHIKRHIGMKEYICEHCSKAFVTKGDLNKHLRLHKGLTPYKCSVCEKLFSDISTLYRHLKDVHMQVKQFMCSLCQKRFSRHETVLSHVKKNHTVQYNNSGAIELCILDLHADSQVCLMTDPAVPPDIDIATLTTQEQVALFTQP